MRIGLLAQACGVSVETIRYYERAGILPAPARGANNYRHYTQAHQARLGFVRRARAVGFSLDDVRSLLAMIDDGHPTCAEVRELGRAHLEEVRTRLQELQRLESAMAELVAHCDGGRTRACSLLESLSGSVQSAQRCGSGGVPLSRGCGE